MVEVEQQLAPVGEPSQRIRDRLAARELEQEPVFAQRDEQPYEHRAHRRREGHRDRSDLVVRRRHDGRHRGGATGKRHEQQRARGTAGWPSGRLSLQAANARQSMEAGQSASRNAEATYVPAAAWNT